MSHRLSLLWILLTGVLVSAGCSERATSDVSGSVSVRLPWKTHGGDLQLQEVPLHDLENLQTMKGRYAQFFYAPKILPEGLEGQAPRGQFLQTKSGLYVPQDELSQQIASVYAQMQSLFALDQRAGAGEILSWPRKIGISVRIRHPQGGLWTDNSFYDGGSDAILVVQNPNGQWPLAVNPGVIAHEHFHALFFQLILKPLLEEKVLTKNLTSTAHAEQKIMQAFGVQADESRKLTPPPMENRQEAAVDNRIYNTAFLKSVNEGLADVWGWIYSGQPDFLGKSVPRMTEARTLRASEGRQTFTPTESFVSAVRRCLFMASPDACLNEFAYRPGSELSRALRSIFLGDLQEASVSGRAVRERLAARLIKALPLIAQDVRKSTAEQRMNFDTILKTILAVDELSTEEKLEAKCWSESAIHVEPSR